MKIQFRNVTIDGDHIEGEKSYGTQWGRFSARRDLLRISLALDEGAFQRILPLADGYGAPGFFPGGYDWSGIRDSSEQAIARMDEEAARVISDERMLQILGISI